MYHHYGLHCRKTRINTRTMETLHKIIWYLRPFWQHHNYVYAHRWRRCTNKAFSSFVALLNAQFCLYLEGLAGQLYGRRTSAWAGLTFVDLFSRELSPSYPMRRIWYALHICKDRNIATQGLIVPTSHVANSSVPTDLTALHLWHSHSDESLFSKFWKGLCPPYHLHWQHGRRTIPYARAVHIFQTGCLIVLPYPRFRTW